MIESQLGDELVAVRAALREARILETEANARALAIADAYRALSAETTRLRDDAARHEQELSRAVSERHAARAQRDSQRARADGLSRELRALEEEIAELQRERRILANRSRRLDELLASRSYRLIKLTWRVRARLAAPWRRLRHREHR